ncbi:hypothetical protein M7I_4398 [Glarea lozoyensis 74030]|uniref:Uncharacterized protein n=1 Tax=Glarea lozoyensis (strain ATCC 74030 / MF5533) TaxID=1104152 RepID=H0EP30_GLAL7|nr:hypothetical protein M7I_4398 [Glarea lozoyensis 74030]
MIVEKHYVGDRGDWKFKTTYGAHLMIMGGVISRVIPGRPIQYNLSDWEGNSIAEGINENDLELQRDEYRPSLISKQLLPRRLAL